MATVTSRPTETDDMNDIVRRGVKRTLPCKLSDEELLEIARNRVAKEALRDQLEADFTRLKKRHTDQVDELEDEDGKMRRELHSGEQDRTVPCNEYFRRDLDGTGWIHTVRMDTMDEVERRPATPAETQRFLPSLDAPTGTGPLLDQAAAAQGTAGSLDPAGDDGVPPELAGDEAEDDGTEERPPHNETPAQRSARESEEGRAARRAAGKPKRAGKGK